MGETFGLKSMSFSDASLQMLSYGCAGAWLAPRRSLSSPLRQRPHPGPHQQAEKFLQWGQGAQSAQRVTCCLSLNIIWLHVPHSWPAMPLS